MINEPFFSFSFFLGKIKEVVGLVRLRRETESTGVRI